MFYRLHLLLNFTDQDAIDDIVDKIQDHLDSAITINPGEDAEENSFYEVHCCFHDQDPTQPCDELEKWESQP